MLTANTSGLTRGVRRGKQELLSLGSVARSVSKSLAAVGAPLAAGLALRGLARTGAGFEAQMSEVLALTRASQDEFAALNTLAEDMGRRTAFSNREAAQAMTELAKAGLNTREIMSALPDTLSLAAAGGLQMGEAATIAASAMKKFNLTSDDTGRIADVLSAGATSALTDVRQIGEQLTFAASSARDAGMSIEQTVAALAVLSDEVDGSIAGTGLRQVFAAIAGPSREAQQALNRLGLSFKDVETGGFKTLDRIVDEFNTALGGLDAFDRKQVLESIFPSRAGNAFSGLLNRGGEGLREQLATVRDSLGEADRIAATKLDNVQGAFTKLTSAVSGFATDVFQEFQGPLKNGLTGLADLVNGPLTKAFQSVAPFIHGTMQGAVQFVERLREVDAGPLMRLASGFAAVRASVFAASTAMSVLRSAASFVGAPFLAAGKHGAKAITSLRPAASLMAASVVESGRVAVGGLHGIGIAASGLPSAFRSAASVIRSSLASAAVAGSQSFGLIHSAGAATALRTHSVFSVMAMRVRLALADMASAARLRSASMLGSFRRSSRESSTALSRIRTTGLTVFDALAVRSGRTFGLMSASLGKATKLMTASLVATKVAALSMLGPVRAAAATAFSPLVAGASRVASLVPAAMSGLAGSVRGVATMFGALAGPIGLLGTLVIGAALSSEQGMSGIRKGIDSLKEHWTGIVTQMQHTALAGFNAIVGIARGFLALFGHEFDTTGTDIVTRFNNTMGGLGAWVQDALTVTEFFFSNLGRYYDLALARGELWLQSIGHDVGFLFTDQLPAMFDWFTENWGTIWRDAANYTLTVLENLGANVRNIFGELWDFIASGGKNPIEFDLKPLEAGFRRMTEELELPERQLSEVESALQNQIRGMEQALDADLGEFLNKRQQELDALRVQPDANDAQANDLDALRKEVESTPTLPDVTVQPQMESVPVERPVAALLGSKDAYQTIVRAITGSQDRRQREMLQAAKKSATENTKQTGLSKDIATELAKFNTSLAVVSLP